MFLSKNVVNRFKYFFVMGLMCSGLFFNSGVAMDPPKSQVPSELEASSGEQFSVDSPTRGNQGIEEVMGRSQSSGDSLERKNPIDFGTLVNLDLPALGLDEVLTRNGEKNKGDLADPKKIFIFGKLKEHALLYPTIICEEGLKKTQLFLSKLEYMVKLEFLLRNDGEGNMNKVYYEVLRKLDFDYTRLYILAAYPNNNQYGFDLFYENGLSDLFQSELIRCQNQKNGFLVIVKELHFFSEKLGIQLSRISDKSLTESVEDLQKNLSYFKEISAFHDFISLCKKEREEFSLLLNRLIEFIVMGGSVPSIDLFAIDVKLADELNLCNVILEQRAKLKAIEYEKREVSELENENSETLSDLPKKIDSETKRKGIMKRLSGSPIPGMTKKEGSPSDKRMNRRSMNLGKSKDKISPEKEKKKINEKKDDKKDK